MSYSSVEEQLLKRKAELLQYANNKRIDGDFNDVTIQAGVECISANRMVLACYSKFFESMFLSPLKEKYQNRVEIKEFDGKAVKQVIEFIYAGNIDIDSNNVLTLLGTADFLQVDDVKKMCFDFMETSLTVDSCLDVVKASVLYNNPCRQLIYQYISDNFHEIAQEDNFKELSKDELILLMANLSRATVEETNLYDALLNWTKHDQNRDADFPALFLNLNLQKLSFKFMTCKVANEPLVKANIDCLNALVSYFSDNSTGFAGNSADTKVTNEKASKILCIGGVDSKSVSEVFSVSGETLKNYPHLPHKISDQCVLKLHDFVYCIGGYKERCITNHVYRLNLRDTDSEWEEVASMAAKRSYFGAAVYKGCLVVSGGKSTGSRINTTEQYEPRLNKWNTIASLNKARDGHVLVAANDSLFAIGGWDEECQVLHSKEQLDSLHGKWKEVQPLNEARSQFAAVACNNFIYAFGGERRWKAGMSVEKYDCNKKQWSFVNSMKINRDDHVACVLSGKIYVVGGMDANGEFIKAVECYDSASDEWTEVGEVDIPWGQTMVGL